MSGFFSGELENTTKFNYHSCSIGHIEKCDSGETLHQSAKSTEQSDSTTFDDQFPSKPRESRSPGRYMCNLRCIWIFGYILTNSLHKVCNYI